MRLEFDSSNFEAGLRHMVGETTDATRRAVEDGMAEVQQVFRSTARVLSGEYRDSFVMGAPVRRGDGWESTGGPDTPYARRLERKYGEAERAFRQAEGRVAQVFASDWGRAVT